MKTVSVIIPAYNKAELTVRTVRSVLDQTYSQIEILVVDDGSKDNTAEKLEPFSKEITYIYKENGGACSARNRGIEEAAGDYIALIDCDDIYYPEKIEKSVKCLEKDPSLGFVHTPIKLIDDTDNEIGFTSYPADKVQGSIAHQLIVDNLVNNSTTVIKKKVFEKVGYFDESIFIPADWDMWLRISEHFAVGYVDEALTGYRITENYTKSHLEVNEREQRYVLRKAYERQNIDISGKLKKRCEANLSYRMGKLYGSVGEMDRAQHFFREAVLNDFQDPRLVYHFFMAKVFPRVLERDLKKRYKMST